MQRHPLAIHTTLLMLALAVQYALGMYVNMFVAFPDGLNQGQLWEFAWSQPPLAAHIILAFLIFFGAIALCIRAYRRKERRLIWSSFAGLIAVFCAAFSGAQFIPSQVDAYSYSMALFFLIAFFSYAWALFGNRTASASV